MNRPRLFTFVLLSLLLVGAGLAVYDTVRPEVLPDAVSDSFLIFAVLAAMVGLQKTWTYSRERQLMAHLQTSEARLQAFLDNSPVIMFIKDTSSRYVTVNPSFESSFGLRADEVIGKTDAELMRGAARESCMVSDAAVLKSGMPMESEESAEHADGVRTSIIHKFPIRDANGEICGIAGVITDITEHQKNEEALRRSEERYRSLFQSARDAILILSPEGVIIARNMAARMIDGRSDEKVLNHEFTPFVAPEDLERAMEMFSRAAKGERCDPFEIGVLGAEGPVAMEFSLTPQVENGAVTSILAIGRDISQRRVLEEQLRHAQKMDCVGKLAGGVAHDFNNLLTVVNGNASLIALEETATPAIREMANEICEAADRAARLTRQLIAFSRRQPLQASDIALNDVTAELIKMLRRLIGENITLEFVPGDDLPLIHADAGMIEQVLVNLSVNARDAMPHGGQLTIRTDQCILAPATSRRTPQSRPGHFIRLSVSDNGHGIAPEHRPYIFEPFFTTKEAGKGTGIGLATVYSIVNQHQGWIEVHSEPGSGTRFEIYFPVSQTASPTPAEPIIVRREAMGGHETILIVEDETALRGVVRSLLCRMGYRVLEASSGVEALKVWEQHRAEIDLVFTDVVMPDGVSGPQLAAELRKHAPELKVLFTSGYSGKALAADHGLGPKVDYLQKPYLPERLAAAIRNALEAAA